MSYPLLKDESAKQGFGEHCIGVLSACIKCEVTEERNGVFELVALYPIDGLHYNEIRLNRIIEVKLDEYEEPQMFRIYHISRPMSKVVTIKANHISYDLSYIPVPPLSATTVSSALSSLRLKAVVEHGFNFWTDKEIVANFSVKEPSSIRSNLGGSAGSILDVYDGEYAFDNFTVRLYNNRGEDRGFVISYGKNLLDINQEENMSNVVTGVYPYWVDENGENLVQLDEKIVNAPGNYNFTKIVTLNMSESFEEKPTQDQLRNAAQSYINRNQIGIPKVSLSVSYASIEQSQEYSHLKIINEVKLCDTVQVEFPLLNISAKAKIVKKVYDVLFDRVQSATVGSIQTNIADTIAGIQSAQNKRK